MARKSARTIGLEEGILNSVELLDCCDGSRVDLVNTLDQVREMLVDSYGDEFQTDYDEMLGLEAEDEDETETVKFFRTQNSLCSLFYFPTLSGFQTPTGFGNSNPNVI